MADIIKNENFTADVLLNLLSETTDDYLYMWDIRNGTFYISDNAYDDLDISRLIEQDVVSVWSKIMVREDLELWLSDIRRAVRITMTWSTGFIINPAGSYGYPAGGRSRKTGRTVRCS